MSSNSHNNHGTFNNAFLFLNEEENRTATETRLPNRCSTPPAEEKETARQLFALALRVRDLLVLADTATVAEWRSTELVASWKLVIRFTQKLACLSAAQRCALCIQLRPHLKPSTICSDENTIQRDGDKREDNNPSGDLVNGVTFCELSQADKTLQRRLSANSHLRNCLYDQLQRLAKTSTDQFREVIVMSTSIKCYLTAMMIGCNTSCFS
ncbi:hypothetical protein BDF19DRAFT_119886 [Syncephalis fuscata]|nr:hypothetical protein BDF19DRAFT_119886 [Syncephalis fuscata]